MHDLAMEGQTYSIRPLSEDDLSSILKIENEVQIAPWSEKGFLEEREKPYSETLVLTDDDTDEVIAGYIVFWTLGNETQIHNVAVSKSFQRRGFALILLRCVINQALKAHHDRVFLYVRKNNAPAILLYQKLNFSVTQIRKAFYSNGEDAYQMDLNLQRNKVDFP